MRITRGGGIFQQEAIVAAVVGVAHGGGDADVGGDAHEDEVLDSPVAEEEVEIRVGEGAAAWFVDDRFAG